MVRRQENSNGFAEVKPQVVASFYGVILLTLNSQRMTAGKSNRLWAKGPFQDKINITSRRFPFIYIPNKCKTKQRQGDNFRLIRM